MIDKRSGYYDAGVRLLRRAPFAEMRTSTLWPRRFSIANRRESSTERKTKRRLPPFLGRFTPRTRTTLLTFLDFLQKLDHQLLRRPKLLRLLRLFPGLIQQALTMHEPLPRLVKFPLSDPPDSTVRTYRPFAINSRARSVT
jgi:hypothetical protein